MNVGTFMMLYWSDNYRRHKTARLNNTYQAMLQPHRKYIAPLMAKIGQLASREAVAYWIT
jgi:hypothetical protein